MTNGLDVLALSVIAGVVVATGACVAIAPTKQSKRDEKDERLLALIERQEARIEERAAQAEKSEETQQ